MFHAAPPASGIIGKSREFMNTDINLRILDRFRHVGRMLRVADNPCSGSLRDPGLRNRSRIRNRLPAERNCILSKVFLKEMSCCRFSCAAGTG